MNGKVRWGNDRPTARHAVRTLTVLGEYLTEDEPRRLGEHLPWKFAELQRDE
jgi:hypothetical protein